MKKFLAITLAAGFVSTSAFAGEAVLKCRTSGIVGDKTDTYSMDCGSMSEFECKQKFERQLEQQFGSKTGACEKAAGSQWYSDGIVYRY